MRPITTARARVLIALALFAVVVGAVIVAGLQLRAHPEISAAETGLLRWLDQHRTRGTDMLAVGINYGFGTIGAAALTLVLAMLLALGLRSWRQGVKLLILVAVPWGVAEGVKLIVQRPRPDRSMWPQTLVPEPVSTSFPSGHTAFAAALMIALVLLAHQLGARSIAPLAGIAVLVVATTAWSRMYLGVHHLTDVTASMLVVPAASTLVWAMLRLRSALIAQRSAV